MRTFGVVVFVCAAMILHVESFAVAQEVKKAVHKSAVEEKAQKQIEAMGKALARLVVEEEKARKEQNVGRLNCLTKKVNLLRGLLTASERARLVLVRAVATGNPETSQGYATKIQAYFQSSNEVLASVTECYEGEGVGLGETMVYIYPEGGEDLEFVDLAPWDRDLDVGAGENYPVVPPASPFR